MNNKNAQRGAGMVEFAVTAAGLMMLILGIVEFGRVMYTYHTVSNAARLGSRYAIVRGKNCTVLDNCPDATSAQIQDWVRSHVPMVDGSQLMVTAAWSTSSDPNTDCSAASPAGNDVPGHLVCVTVSYPFNFVAPLVSTSALTLSSTSKMVISN